MRHTASVEAIDALLPQTQCTRCGYNGCLPYAEALSRGEEALNRCPPGGSATIQRLAALLDTPALPLDTRCGVEAAPQVVWIDPERCIGCARCLPPCPVDAIVGAQRQLHVVLEDRCTGCELCIAPCPVDCIVLRPRQTEHGPAPLPTDNRQRHHAHRSRRERREAERLALLAERKRLPQSSPP
ncbi:MAG: RnfABCDGE type electron transport complex subunit B [Nevskiaceae bacterium]